MAQAESLRILTESQKNSFWKVLKSLPLVTLERLRDGALDNFLNMLF